MSNSSMAKTSADLSSSSLVKKSGAGCLSEPVHHFTTGAIRASSSMASERTVHITFKSERPSRKSPRAAEPYTITDSRFDPRASCRRSTRFFKRSCISRSRHSSRIHQLPDAPPPPLLPPPKPPKPPENPPEPPPKPPPLQRPPMPPSIGPLHQ